MSVKELWDEFGNVPMDPETECIEEPWRGFEKGTNREEVWHWFEEKYGVSVADLMYHKYDELLQIINTLNLSKGDVLLEAECVEEYREWMNMALIGYMPDDLFAVAKWM